MMICSGGFQPPQIRFRVISMIAWGDFLSGKTRTAAAGSHHYEGWKPLLPQFAGPFQKLFPELGIIMTNFNPLAVLRLAGHSR